MRGGRFLSALFRRLGEDSPQVPRRRLARLSSLFAGRVKDEWLERNQKLDVCVSSSAPSSFRFSVSDFGERGALSPVIAAYAAGFRGLYDLAALRRFLAAGRAAGPGLQTTLGVDWGGGEKAPRLKIYFEELFPSWPAAAKRKLARDCFGPAAAAALRKDGAARLAAVCLDLAPGLRTDAKFYFRYDDLRSLPVRGWSRRALARLAGERNCFYYLMRAPGSGRCKAYKVYEVAGIRDFSPAVREICALYAAEGCDGALRKVLACVGAAGRAGMAAAPVLFAAGDGAGGRGRTLDSYFCFKAAA